MKIYFEKFGEGRTPDYLTPMKMYEVVEHTSDGEWVVVEDDVGDPIRVVLANDPHTGSSWKICSEEPKTQSASDIVASIESERNALANSIDNANSVLDNLFVPEAETLGERIKLLSSKSYDSTGVSIRVIDSNPLFLNRGVEVEMTTGTGRVVSFLAKLKS